MNSTPMYAVARWKTKTEPYFRQKEEAMKSVTVAGIDCGTNSIRLKVSRVSEDGVEDIVPRILRVIRLGQDVDKTHRFADEAWNVPTPLPRIAEVLKSIRWMAFVSLPLRPLVMLRTVRNSKTLSSRSSACVRKSFPVRKRLI